MFVLGWDSSDACYDDVRYTGWHTGYPDALVRLDLSTYRRVPWDGGVAFFLGEFVESDGATPLSICPRQLAQSDPGARHGQGAAGGLRHGVRVVQFPRDAAIVARQGLHAPEPITPACSATRSCVPGRNRPFINALMDELAAFRVQIEGLHTETGPGVYEGGAAIRAKRSRRVTAPLLFKTSAKEIGQCSEARGALCPPR